MPAHSAFPVPDSVITDLRAAQSREVLRQISRALELATGISSDSLHVALLAAEQLGGSAIGDGVAVVGARLPVHECGGRRLAGFAMLAKPVMFKGVETHPCEMVYVLVSPEDEAQNHLRDLSSIIRAFRDRDFIDRLQTAGTPDRITSLFRARDIKLTQAAA
jgi:mannitol/fructose-specific phosphotransferase system IIA component (Ntr-type)